MRWTRHEAYTGGGGAGTWGDLIERDHFHDLGADGIIILKRIFKKWDGGVMDWIDMAHERDSWRALVNVLINLWVP